MTLRRRKPLILAMILLTTLTVAFVGGIGIHRRAEYQALADHHLAEMAAFDSIGRSEGNLADMYEGKVPKSPVLAFMNPGDPAQIRTSQVRNAELAAHHASLSQKYQQAADRPWIVVDPDPLHP